MNRIKIGLFASTLALPGLAGLAGLAGFPGVAAAQDDAKVRKDLTSVIALQGQPCTRVTEAERRAENDYLVECASGDRYRVYVNAANRVVVEKR